ncbi:hypothetical protein DIPPA_03049 [Diplonema papillatum]|nr:hypothetical protein DIPPA_03049 [Diplonema papillatum]
MPVEERLKILLLGPKKVGKTCLANYLSGFKDTPAAQYKETVAVRVIDFEPEGSNALGRRNRVVVELWDVSGNHSYQPCWAACAQGAHGLIFVFNIEQKQQLSELEYWYKMFNTPNGVLGQGSPSIADTSCLVLAHRSTAPQGNIKVQKPRLPGRLQDIKCLATSLDHAADNNWKAEFDALVSSILIAQRHEEENAFLNSGMDGPLPVQSSQ